MKIERGYAQHVGSRNEQQDAGLVLTDDGRTEQLVVVADGMGGHAGGSLASAQVAETARRVWSEHKKAPLEPKRLLERIIREGHEAINKAGAEKGLTPRSTCALLYLRNGDRASDAHWAHVGDSRIYRLRDGQVARLTRDHSVVQMLVDLGKVSEDEMGTHPDQNRLTQSLGGEAQPMPDFGSDGVKEHDAFLVCSDGLWEMIPQVEMAAALAAKKLGDDGAKHLVERAFDRAKPKSDNITVALVRMGGPPPGSIGAALEDEARTTRMPAAMKRPAARGTRWGFAAATVVALGAAAALVYKPWDKAGQGGDTGTQPAVGPRERPADPPPPERRSEPPKQEAPKSEPPKPDAEPKPAERREAPPPPQPRPPEVTPPKDPAAPAPEQSKPPPAQPDQGSTTPPPKATPQPGGPPKEAQPKPRQQPRQAQPAPTPPRQSGVGPGEKKADPPVNTDKPADTPPRESGEDSKPKPQ